jgi:hypothetical protein
MTTKPQRSTSSLDHLYQRLEQAVNTLCMAEERGLARHVLERLAMEHQRALDAYCAALAQQQGASDGG